MAAIIVRNLDEDVRRRIKERAVANNRSMEAEARAILTSAVSRTGLVEAWLSLAGDLPSSAGADFTLPERSRPRDVDFS